MDVFRMLRSVFAATGVCRKPKDDEWMKFFGPFSELSKKAQGACDNRSDYFHHRKASCEVMGIIMLVTMPGPSGHCTNILEQMDFHAIKVMQKKNPPETAWINAVKACVKDMSAWCTSNCKMGLDWKVGGQDPVEYFAASPLGTKASGAPAAAPKAGGKGKGKGPPMPKGGVPPPPKDEDAPKPAGGGGGGGGMAAIFEDLRSGVGGLRKVKDEEKCKNRKDEPAFAPVKPKAAAAVKAAVGRLVKGPKGDPKMEFLEAQNTWMVKNYTASVTIEEGVEQHHSVRIQDCSGATVRIGSRVKNVFVDGCLKTTVCTKDVISVVELVNGERLHLYIEGKVNMVAVDKCDGVGIHLNKDSLAAEIASSKSSEMNVTIPDDQGDEYDTIEIPIPEQFVSKVVGRKVVTEVSHIYSS
jgi:adenylyl cyclase-associated protein